MELDLLGQHADRAYPILSSLRIRQECHTPPGRMGSPDWYCRTDGLFELPRPE